MQRHFHQELEALKNRLIRMGSTAEQAVDEALRAFLERSPERAEGVFRLEQVINTCELEIDNAVVDLLALQQPVAADLRFILAAMKINNDLERIGDHAVNIAQSAVTYASRQPIQLPPDIPEMALIAKEMLKTSLDGFVHGSSEQGRAVLRKDDSIDSLNRKIGADIIGFIRTSPDSVEQWMDLVRVSRNLERIADLATNIAEEVIFAAEAQTVKHHGDRPAASA